MSFLEVSVALAHSTAPFDNLLALDPNDVKAGWVALGLVALMGVALYFILRSFVKQLKRVNFDEGPTQPTPGRPTIRSDDEPSK